jgi:hypothetical protein
MYIHIPAEESTGWAAKKNSVGKPAGSEFVLQEGFNLINAAKVEGAKFTHISISIFWPALLRSWLRERCRQRRTSPAYRTGPLLAQMLGIADHHNLEVVSSRSL